MILNVTLEFKEFGVIFFEGSPGVGEKKTKNSSKSAIPSLSYLQSLNHGRQSDRNT
jgi:hypothetical protein